MGTPPCDGQVGGASLNAHSLSWATGRPRTPAFSLTSDFLSFPLPLSSPSQLTFSLGLLLSLARPFSGLLTQPFSAGKHRHRLVSVYVSSWRRGSGGLQKRFCRLQ